LSETEIEEESQSTNECLNHWNNEYISRGSCRDYRDCRGCVGGGSGGADCSCVSENSNQNSLKKQKLSHTTTKSVGRPNVNYSNHSRPRQVPRCFQHHPNVHRTFSCSFNT
jgi:hypothetical protein